MLFESESRTATTGRAVVSRIAPFLSHCLSAGSHRVPLTLLVFLIFQNFRYFRLFRTGRPFQRDCIIVIDIDIDIDIWSLWEAEGEPEPESESEPEAGCGPYRESKPEPESEPGWGPGRGWTWGRSSQGGPRGTSTASVYGNPPLLSSLVV